jgi:hypothetical protein
VVTGSTVAPVPARARVPAAPAVAARAAPALLAVALVLPSLSAIAPCLPGGAAVAAAQQAPRAPRPRARVPRVARPRPEPLPNTPALRAYVQRAVLVLDGVRRTVRWVEVHPGNEELARFALPILEQHVALAGRTTPPGDLRVAHPHLLLVTENAERAVAALARGDATAFRQHLRTMREELRTLQAVFAHYGVELPEIGR